MPYDLFISYSRRDNEQGRITQLVERIRADFETFAGRRLHLFFDVTEIDGMEDWRHKILQGLRESRLLLACLSPSYLTSEYCEWEFNEYLKHEIGRTYFGDGVAPIYFVDVPGWGDKGFERQCAAWVAELRHRQHFDLRPWFTAGEEALRDATVKARMQKLNEQLKKRILHSERTEQSLGNVDTHNPHFIGRTTELRRLRDQFVKPGTIGVLTAVHGLGGVGKSALAIEYAHAFAYEYGGGRWQVRCEGKEDLLTAIAELATPLGIEFTDEEKKDPHRQFERVLLELKTLVDTHQPHRCLLILDNVDRPTLLDPVQTKRLPAEEWLHIIATTRLGASDLHGKQKDRAFLPVDELPEADAIELVQAYQPGGTFRSHAERDAAREIVNLLGRFTLAVETAAVYLGQFSGEVTCADFVARLKKEGLAGLDLAAVQTSEGVRHGEKRLAVTLAPTLERLSGPERLALGYAALLPADHVPLPWLRTLVGAHHREMVQDAEPGYPDPWRALLRRLFSLRLFQATGVVDADGRPLVVRMHRLVQELVRKQTSDATADLLPALSAHLNARADFIWDGWVQREHRWEIEPLIAAAWHMGSAHVAYKVAAQPMRELGNLVEAKRLLQKAVALWEKSLDPNDTLMAAGYSGLAQVEQNLGNLVEAKRLLNRTVAILEQAVDDPGRSLLATSYSNLATVEQGLGNFAEAKRLLQKAIAIQDQTVGDPNHLSLATRYSNLAAVEQALGNLADAKRLLQQAVAIEEKAFPDQRHPSLARSYSNLGLVEQALGNFAEAKRLLQRAVTIWEAVFEGLNHPSLAASYSGLGLVEQDLGDLVEAKRLLQKAGAMFEAVYDGLDHPSLAKSYSNLATVERDVGNLAEAKRLLQRAVAIEEKAFRDQNHPSLATSYFNLAAVERDLGNLAEAKRLLQKAVAIWEKVFEGVNHPSLASGYSRLGLVEKALGNLAEAKRLLQKAVAIWETVYKELNHPTLATDYSNLAQVEQNLGNLAEAKRLLQKAVAILEQVVDDPGHSLLASSYSNLATVEQASGNFAEAKRLMQEAVAIWERNTNLKTPSLGTGYFNLATVEQVLGNVTNAESLYQRALAIRETVLGPLHPDVANCLHGLAVTYINQGRYAQAAPLMERAIEILLRASQSTGSAHPYLQKTVNNYVTLLDRMGRSREEAMVQLNQLGGAFGFHFGG